jgi:hypothetical protein
MLAQLAALLLLCAPAHAAPKKKPDLKALLLSSAWCSFSYNKVSGTTKTKRVAFMKDGTWSAGGRRESYSSGMYGSVAGQSDSEEGGRWAVKDGRLLMSNPPDTPELEDVGLTLSYNSNGYPILASEGVEYSQCK